MNKEIMMYRGLILLLCLAIFGLSMKLAQCYLTHNNQEGEVETTNFDPTYAIVSSTEDSIALPLHSHIKATLSEALESRQTTRSYSTKDLNDQQIADLLWASTGVNREDGKRTTPTARNAQEMDIYLFTKSAIYRYQAESNSLKLVKSGDYRTKAGMQPFYGEASVALSIVADFDKMKDFDEAGKQFYSATDAGYISQDIYLYCAATGLATVACGSVERDALVELLGLSNAKAVLSHPVGYPAE